MSRVQLQLQHTASIAKALDKNAHEHKAWTEPAVDFKSGMFRPVVEEADGLTCEIIQGELPLDMPSGTYFRNGPNPFHPPGDNDPYHYFDGDGMIASFNISHNSNNKENKRTVLFSHKWIKTERLIHDKIKQKSVYEFGGMATGTLMFGSDVSNENGNRMGKANTSLIFHHNKLLALEEADMPYRIHPKTLDTLGLTYHFGKNMNRTSSDSNNEPTIFTAHPKIDYTTRELIGYGCGYDPTKQILNYYVINPDGNITTNFPITLRHTSYMHDFAITTNYSICFDGNLILNWKKLFAATTNTNANSKSNEQQQGMWEFKNKNNGRIGIFPRHAKSEEEVVWFDVQPFCVSHTVNAYEEDHGNVIVLICNNIGHEGFQPKFPLETPQDPLANLHEWRFYLNTKHVEERALRRNLRSDFPAINLQYTGKKFRYIYAQLLNYEEPNHAPFLFGTYKYDLHTNTYKEEIWKGSDDRNDDTGMFHGCEGIFIPRTNNNNNSCDDEDNGFMLVLVNNVNKRRTELRIYDCKRLGEANALVCTIQCPRRLLPLGTHGIWLDENQVENGCR
jgi:carotenoid 9,10(9',10')-cleavage dioxygenase 1